MPVYPLVPDPYASLTPAKLASFGIGTSRAPATNADDDDEEEDANDNEEMEDDK
jgi:hypothetical protein